MATMDKHSPEYIAELKSQLAELENKQPVADATMDMYEAVTAGTPLEGTIDGAHDGLYLTVRGEDFECRRVSTTYQMMKFAKAQRDAQVTIPKGLPEDSPRRKELEDKRNSAGMLMMALLLETANILLKPHERERFDEYMTDLAMSEEGVRQGELEDAIGETIAAAGGEQGKAQQTTSQQSSASSRTTKRNSVVSLSSKATAKKHAPSQS